jgi:hypothetical protein
MSKGFFLALGVFTAFGGSVYLFVNDDKFWGYFLLGAAFYDLHMYFHYPASQ